MPEGTAHENSDVDIAIVVNGLSGDFFLSDHYFGKTEEKLMIELNRY